MYFKYFVNGKEVIETVIFENPVKSYEQIYFTFDLDTFMRLEICYDDTDCRTKKTFYMATFRYYNGLYNDTHYSDGLMEYMRIVPDTLQTMKPSTSYYCPLNDSRGAQQESMVTFSRISTFIIHVIVNDCVIKVLNFKIN
jgi:hypothetical protein